MAVTGDYALAFWATAIPWLLNLVNLATYPAALEGPRRESVSLAAAWRHLRDATRRVLRTAAMRRVVLEAMSFGVPVVAANVGGIPEVVQDGLTGFLFTPGDIDDFHRCLLPLLDDQPLRTRLGSAALARAAEFSAEAMAAKYLDIYRTVAGGNS